MNTLINQIKTDLKNSMLAKNALTTEVLRGVISQARYKMVEVGKKEDEITDADLLKVIEKQAKRRNDSIEAFKKGNRLDLAEKEQQELVIINKYLPKKLSEGETEEIVKKAINELNITSKQQMGQLMGYLNKNYAGQVDMGMASKLINTLVK